ncbi:MAG: hypothetical protein D6750_03710 [Bacteroidetes bacterium]|nr:MAG: hypothetical protein D6750_03710 [Bacteroidota bacterium]
MFAGSKATSQGVIARLWGPLALNWLMMALEGPLLVGLVSRLPEATPNLAAFSVAFAIALMVEAPVMMLLSTSAALAEDRLSYERIWAFALGLTLPLSALMAVIGIPGVFHWLNERLWNLPAPLSEWVAGAVRLLIPWPAVIGLRRLWQGLLIRQGRSRLVAWGTVLRLAGMATGAALAYVGTSWPGVWIAATALSAGVTTEMLAIRLWAHPILQKLRTTPREAPLSYAHIGAFYAPLLMTSLLNVALTPLLTTLMAQGNAPLLSLAAYPPLTNTVFLFSCVGVAYQEVVIVLLGTRVGPQLLPFAHKIAAGSTLPLALLSAPPLGELWLSQIFAVPPAVEPFVQRGFLILLPMPALVVYLAYLKGHFIGTRRTRLNLLAALVELSAALAISLPLIRGTSLPALYGAALALLSARAAVLIFLWPLLKRQKR